MERIIIIGCPGSGKTTLGRELSAKLGLPLVHLDKLGWQGNWEMTPKEEFDKLLMEELQKPRWIIEGNYRRTIAERLKYCDTVVFMDFPTLKCFYGVLMRVFKNYGKSRPDMGGFCPERIDFQFLIFVLTFKKNHRKNYYNMVSEQSDKKIVIIKSHKQSREWLGALKP